jgi:hypothetical protein
MTMTTRTVVLSRWYTNPRPDLEVDWPLLHREIGEDCVEWLNNKEKQGRVQLIIERQHTRARLSCEFFSEQAYTEYLLRYSAIWSQSRSEQ